MKKATKGIMQTNYLKEFKNITVPTSILWGDKDVFALSKDQDVLKASIKNSKLVIYTGTGHACIGKSLKDSLRN
ncbi:MAG: alpha/beta fold hydrolase [Flavisolibacter sp.]